MIKQSKEKGLTFTLPQMYEQMKVNGQVNKPVIKYKSNSFKTLAEESLCKKNKVIINREKKMLSLQPIKTQTGPGSYNCQSFQKKKEQMKRTEKRNFPHQNASFSGISPNYYFPSQNKQNCGPSFHKQSKVTFFDGIITNQMGNPSVGSYCTIYNLHKSEKRGFSFSKQNSKKKISTNSEKKLDLQDKNSNQKSKDKRKSSDNVTANFRKKAEKKIVKPKEKEIDHRKYSNLIDWSQKKNTLKIQSKGPQKNIYY